MTSPIRLLFSFLLSLALHRCLLIEIRERRYTPPRTRPNARRIDRCTLVLRIWRPEVPRCGWMVGNSETSGCVNWRNIAFTLLIRARYLFQDREREGLFSSANVN